MYRVSRYAWNARSQITPLPPRNLNQLRKAGHIAALPISSQVPYLWAPREDCSSEVHHIQEVSDHLSSKGILKISLGFQDNESRYLEKLILGLHKHHGHGLPVTHSASRGWFWDIRPSSVNFQTANCQARSETMADFPWHTDCSYEDPPPRYFALQVLQPDRFGGGVLSLMNVQGLSELLSPSTREALMRPEYKITTPPEFIKQSEGQNITRSLLSSDADGQPSLMRFRGDIVTPLNSTASQALEDLAQIITSAAAQPHITTHLTAADLPERTIVLVNNRRWLHARTDVKDPERHLRRVRWDAAPLHIV
ncbi:hypothetical protein GGS21DRAFT_517744 [Xylaria nigripes]|nr:hypothetical protein GGS21DRAFT_102195 [Xylaria nigripes]KAI2635263.1 hypothetical protein GGS21DRAFT_517744 [Xylaria nigripes]